MLALRAALAAYRDGWSRVLGAPWLIVGLVAAVTAVQGLGAIDPGEFRWLAGAFAAQLTATVAGATGLFYPTVTLAAAFRGFDGASWFFTLLAIVIGTFLTGGALDRYARQRPVDARTFWGVSGELGGRLLRLQAVGLLILAAFDRVLGWLPSGGSGSSSFIPSPSSLQDLLRFLAAFVVLALVDAARVRIVVERRRSVIFALLAGGRFARRRAGALLFLYLVLFASLGVPVIAFHAVRWGLDIAWPAEGLVWALWLSRLTLALVGGAARTSLFQTSLAHAGYVAPPRLVWPESPAIETLGERRDFPPAV
jgi:hypothetical protein